MLVAKKIWKITQHSLPKPVFVKALSENDAKITFMNNFFGTDKAHVFVTDPSFKIEAATFEGLPEQFTIDECLSYDF